MHLTKFTFIQKTSITPRAEHRLRGRRDDLGCHRCAHALLVQCVLLRLRGWMRLFRAEHRLRGRRDDLGCHRCAHALLVQCVLLRLTLDAPLPSPAPPPRTQGRPRVSPVRPRPPRAVRAPAPPRLDAPLP
ncbi:uncharacterized protein Tco025E_02966, partial [Trypanosoma conorhini]